MIVSNKKSSSRPLPCPRRVRDGRSWGRSWEKIIVQKSLNDKSINLSEHRWMLYIAAVVHCLTIQY